jgi:hypothetical protein
VEEIEEGGSKGEEKDYPGTRGGEIRRREVSGWEKRKGRRNRGRGTSTVHVTEIS